MTYSIDLRSRVVRLVESGGSKAEASRRFGVSLWCVADWCKRQELAPKAQSPRHRKIDKEACQVIHQRYGLIVSIRSNDTVPELRF